ncbi:MAG: HAMP domain-containing histidine kinase [Phycisphaeraceae bacterium]|nr:HAMP domain-containing histidine kinase [Phycisphaeraceae bacterium]
MTLARRLLVGTLSILFSLLAVSTVGWLLVERQGRALMEGAAGLQGLAGELEHAVIQNQRLRELLTYSADLATAQAYLIGGHVDDPEIDRLLERAAHGLSPIIQVPDMGDEARESFDLIRTILLQRQQETGSRDGLTRGHLAKLYRVQNRVNRLGDRLRLDAQRAEDEARTQRASAMALKEQARRWRNWARFGLLSLMIGLGTLAAVTALRQYRSVMGPLARLGRGVREITAGRFTSRLHSERDEEFASLAREFNHMAEELDDFYHRLDEQVRRQSSELARAERLASVGFLAAGVAHEINNPLAIISGHAELALRDLNRKGNGSQASSDTGWTLEVIRDEAMRCKAITMRLLDLAADRNSSRQSIDLIELTKQCIEWVKDQRRAVGIAWSFRIAANGRDQTDQARERMPVIAMVEELRQVLMNLLTNAIEAVDGESGRVDVELSVDSRNGRVRCSIRDNGVGMSAGELERVFEPFYSGKRGRGERGMGLGLSISHAIIRKLGGQLTAHSDGPGRGSRFIIELPLAEAEPEPPRDSETGKDKTPLVDER